jgi:hypothetical protein
VLITFFERDGNEKFPKKIEHTWPHARKKMPRTDERTVEKSDTGKFLENIWKNLCSDGTTITNT